MKFHWFLPTNGGDGRQVVSGGHGVSHGSGGRPASVPYLGQIARSAEQLGGRVEVTPGFAGVSTSSAAASRRPDRTRRRRSR